MVISSGQKHGFGSLGPPSVLTPSEGSHAKADLFAAAGNLAQGRQAMFNRSQRVNPVTAAHNSRKRGKMLRRDVSPNESCKTKGDPLPRCHLPSLRSTLHDARRWQEALSWHGPTVSTLGRDAFCCETKKFGVTHLMHKGLSHQWNWGWPLSDFERKLLNKTTKNASKYQTWFMFFAYKLWFWKQGNWQCIPAFLPLRWKIASPSLKAAQLFHIAVDGLEQNLGEQDANSKAARGQTQVVLPCRTLVDWTQAVFQQAFGIFNGSQQYKMPQALACLRQQTCRGLRIFKQFNLFYCRTGIMRRKVALAKAILFQADRNQVVANIKSTLRFQCDACREVWITKNFWKSKP